MAEMSRRFNFDDFQAQIDEALTEHGPITRVPRPGEIGAVPVRLTTDLDPPPDYDIIET